MTLMHYKEDDFLLWCGWRSYYCIFLPWKRWSDDLLQIYLHSISFSKNLVQQQDRHIVRCQPDPKTWCCGSTKISWLALLVKTLSFDFPFLSRKTYHGVVIVFVTLCLGCEIDSIHQSGGQEKGRGELDHFSSFRGF